MDRADRNYETGSIENMGSNWGLSLDQVVHLLAVSKQDVDTGLRIDE